jgi:hypothetical protein
MKLVRDVENMQLMPSICKTVTFQNKQRFKVWLRFQPMLKHKGPAAKRKLPKSTAAPRGSEPFFAMSIIYHSCITRRPLIPEVGMMLVCPNEVTGIQNLL